MSRSRYLFVVMCVPQEDAMAKLEMFKGDGGGGGRGAGGQGEAVASLMKKYQDLKEEYRLYRKKAMHAIQVCKQGKLAFESSDSPADCVLRYHAQSLFVRSMYGSHLSSPGRERLARCGFLSKSVFMSASLREKEWFAASGRVCALSS